MLQLIDDCISACYRPASMLAAAAAELMSSQGLQLSVSDCAELLQRHHEHVAIILDQVSLTHCKPSLDCLSSADVTHLCGFNIMSVLPAISLYLYQYVFSCVANFDKT